MGLYARLMGFEPFKIPIHQFQALMGEFARGTLTGAQTQTAIEALSGAPLSPAEVTEAQALLASIAGSLSAKLARAKEIDDVLLLAESGTPPYNTIAAIKARLGV